MKHIFLYLILLPVFTVAQGLLTPYEKSQNKNYTATWEESVAYYQKLDAQFPSIKMLTYDTTDCGKPLNLVVVSSDGDFNSQSIQQKNKRIVMVNNAIHPGEPEGVDASMMFARDLVTKPELTKLLNKVVFIIIPMYNIDGVLNRTCCSRANQNGPEMLGFRGNYENRDLNRDFIKCDTKNARAFVKIFTEWNPDVLLDNHTSDGADYQYTLTMIDNGASLAGDLPAFVKNTMLPRLQVLCTKSGYEFCPYVETKSETPDSGLVSMPSPPRFSSGFAALNNTIAFTVETHMLKPFNKRVEATYAYMVAILNTVNENSEVIFKYRNYIAKLWKDEPLAKWVLDYEEDTTRFDWITFKGYKAAYKQSEVSGFNRLYYDETKPYAKKIRYYCYAKPKTIVEQVPIAYVVPQSWWRVIELLKLNGVKMERFKSDTSIFNIHFYFIDDFKDARGGKPYEGHYLHTNIRLHEITTTEKFLKGDYLIKTCESKFRFIIETLEPQAPDSYFAWNYFDGCLQQKEYYSDYVFEDVAARLLKEDPKLKALFEEAKAKDKDLATNGQAQLDFVYKHSPYFERTAFRYPVGRVFEK